MTLNIYKNTFFTQNLPNAKYRYSGQYNLISFTVDSNTQKTEQEIYNYLDSCSIDFLLEYEGYIIPLQEDITNEHI